MLRLTTTSLHTPAPLLMLAHSPSAFAAPQGAEPPTPSVAPQPDKSEFTLFHLTPAELMRPLSTDRPDTTESPFTVDAGHLQLEMSFFDLAYGRPDEGESQPARALSVAPLLVKVGVLNNLDIEFGIDPWTREWLRDGSVSSGFGDLLVRVKANLWGNDSFDAPGDTAFALMPYAVFPTASTALDDDSHFAWGIIAPLSIKLEHDWSAGLMAELDFDPGNDALGADETTASLLTSATVAFPCPLIEDLGMFVEYASAVGLNGNAPYAAYFDSGVTLPVGDNTQWDGGIRVGLTDGAEAFACFAGISLRW